MESVWCHDCRARVDVAANALDDAADVPSCPSCSSVFLERRPSANEREGSSRGVLSVFFGPTMTLLPLGAFGEIDFTQFDTRNFDAPCAAATVEALPERDARDAGLASGATCSVCLSEYEGDERVKTIPRCSHTFHTKCLCEWLKMVRWIASTLTRELTDAAFYGAAGHVSGM